MKQGYSKCLTCIVDDDSIINSDEGIYKAVREYDIDCLLIKSKNIDLFELDYEFIKKFIKLKNKEIVSLSKERLLDLGSIIPLMTRKE